jgi:hypothetical protein
MRVWHCGWYIDSKVDFPPWRLEDGHALHQPTPHRDPGFLQNAIKVFKRRRQDDRRARLIHTGKHPLSRLFCGLSPLCAISNPAMVRFAFISLTGVY